MSRKTKILLPVAVVAGAAAVAVLLVRSAPEPPTRDQATPPPLVRALAAERRDVRLDVYAQGTVEARTRATLTAQVAGSIESVSSSFADGGLFGPGEVLVRIDPRDYRLAVSQAESQVAQAEVALAREAAEAEIARQEWRELAAGGAVEGDPGPLARREPQLAEARAALAGAQAAVERARLDLERTTITAPFLGRIDVKQADVGQSVAPGTPLATVYAVDYAEVRLAVPVPELEYLELDLAGEMPNGPEVTLWAPLGGSRRTWRGRAVRTAGGIDPATRMLPVVARVDDPYGEAARTAGAPLPVGLFVEAEIAGRHERDVFVLPRAALRHTGRWREGEPSQVLVVEPGRGEEPTRLRFRDVRVLRLMGDDAVISRGVEDGELICVSALETPTDGMVVRVTEEEEAPAVGADEIAGEPPAGEAPAGEAVDPESPAGDGGP
jgi:RND family efflux transporter MFP subunit